MSEPSPRQALMMTRVLWGGLVGAQVLFGMAVLGLVAAGVVPEHPHLYPTVTYVSAAVLLIATPMAYFGRNQTYKANWQGNSVTPRGYVMGNLVLLVMLESVSLMALVAVLVIGRAIPTVLIAALALGLQLANFPHGRPMQPPHDHTRHDHTPHDT